MTTTGKSNFNFAWARYDAAAKEYKLEKNSISMLIEWIQDTVDRSFHNNVCKPEKTLDEW